MAEAKEKKTSSKREPATKEEALEQFKKAVVEKHPELSY